MKVKSYLVNDMSEAMIKIKSEMGNEAVILSSRKVKKSGIFGFMKKPIFEVVAAIDEEEEKEIQNKDLGLAERMQERKALGNAAYYDPRSNYVPQEMPTQQIPTQQMPVQEIPVQNFQAKEVNDDVSKLSSDVEYLKTMLQSLIEDKRNEKNREVSEKKVETPSVIEESAPMAVESKEEIINSPIGQKAEENAKNNLEEEMLKQEKIKIAADKVAQRANSKKDKIIELFRENGLDQAHFDEIEERLSKQKLSTKTDQNKAIAKLINDIIGEPYSIGSNTESGNVIFFVGPTGVGKTTTIAKVAAKLSLIENKKIGLITADTYRIAAVEQLRTYGEILGVPISVIYEPDELPAAIKKFKDKDFILVDTAGRSYRSEEMQKDLMGLLDKVSKKEILLVVSATTGYRDMCGIIDSYSFLGDYKVVVTKLDETASIGGVIGLKMLTDKPLTYFTIGQNVPDDIEVASGSRIISRMIGE